MGGYEALYHGYLKAVPSDALANSITSTSNTTFSLANDTIITTNITMATETDKCGYPPENAWNMLRGPTDPDMPWPGFLLGQTPASIWYWCADQVRIMDMYCELKLFAWVI